MILRLLSLISLFLSGCVSGTDKDRSTTSKSSPTPNILIIVADDMGYTDLGSFGGEIRTPTLDRLAEEGIQVTNFHVLPTCSPTRSVLLSGADNHLNGLGSMATTLTPRQRGQPGYEGHLNDKVMRLPKLLQNAGYHTYIAGKWHLGHDEKDSPSKNGFDKSFVLLPGGGSHYADKKPLSPPQEMVYRSNGLVIPDLPEDFYSTRNYTDSLLTWLGQDKGTGQPFFAYLAYTAPHDPLHAPEEYIRKYANLYDEGYEIILKKRFERLKSLGLVPPDAPEPVWPAQLPSWASLSLEEQLISSRTMAVYAAMIDYMDGQISRVFDWLRENNQIDNTFIVFFSDNGANAAPATTYPGQTDEYLASFDNHPDNIGLANSYVATGPTWATVSMFPHKFFKGFTTEGGIKSPCIMQVPGIDRYLSDIHSLTHVADLFPTILDFASVPFNRELDARFETLIGVSMRPIFDGREPLERSGGIGYEIFGNRAYFDHDWKIVSTIPPFGDGNWELHNLSKDPYERSDLATQFPEKLAELALKWQEYSTKVGVIYDPVKMNPQMLKK